MSLVVAPPTGLEPVTSWLTVMRSTDWAMEDHIKFSATTFGRSLSSNKVIMSGIFMYTRTTDWAMEEYINVGVFLFSQAASSQLSSALLSLTSVFGMGTGGPSASSTPTIYLPLVNCLGLGDPCEYRTRVAAVRGRSLNRLTNGPILFG